MKKSIMYRKYPKVVKAIAKRNDHYNSELEFIKRMKAKGVVKSIHPKEALEIERTQRDANKLMDTYIKGYERAKEKHEEIKDFIFNS